MKSLVRALMYLVFAVIIIFISTLIVIGVCELVRPIFQPSKTFSLLISVPVTIIVGIVAIEALDHFFHLGHQSKRKAKNQTEEGK